MVAGHFLAGWSDLLPWHRDGCDEENKTVDLLGSLYEDLQRAIYFLKGFTCLPEDLTHSFKMLLNAPIRAVENVSCVGMWDLKSLYDPSSGTKGQCKPYAY